MASLAVEVWRGDPAGGSFQAFEVPLLESQTVLDVVTWIQRHAAPDLSYRFACRVGMCGSCAMTVNGTPRWTCRSHVAKVADKGRLRIEPLANLPLVRDLAVDMAPFFEKWQRARGRFEGTRDRSAELAAISPLSPARAAASAAVECINCAVCYSACDVVRWNKDYLGPAALNRAWVSYNDARDRDPGAVLKAVAAGGGCHACHSHQSCAELCPLGLNPTRAIAGLKRAASAAWLKGQLG